MNDCNFCLDNKKLEGDIQLKNNLFYFVRSLEEILPDSGMIIPFRHIETPFEFSDKEWISLKSFMREVKELLDKEDPDGYNLGWNVGQVGGQNVDHVHLHIIARFKDEPLSGKGIRAHLKSETNKRKG